MFRYTGRSSHGSTLPIFLESESGTYFAKFTAGFAGTYACFTELFLSGWLKASGFNVQEFDLVCLPREFERQLPDPELVDLFRKSNGMVICTPFRNHDTNTGNPIKSNPVFRPVFILDLFLLNVDRSPSNHNIFYSDAGSVFIDWESCLIIPYLLENKEVTWDSKLLPLLRNNPLFVGDLVLNELIQVKNQLWDGLGPWTTKSQSIFNDTDFLLPHLKVICMLNENFNSIINQDVSHSMWKSAMVLKNESERERQERIRANRDSFISGFK